MIENDKGRVRDLAGVPISTAPVTFGTICFRDLPRPHQAPNNGGTEAQAPYTSEFTRVEEQMSLLETEIASTEDILRAEGYGSEADILRTHVLLLRDEGLREQVRKRIEEEGATAEGAVTEVFESVKTRLQRSDHEVTRERAADIEDLHRRLRGGLDEQKREAVLSTVCDVETPVFVTQELLVTDVLEAKDAGVKAIITTTGTPLSHAAIMAKAFGIPVLKVAGVDSLREIAGSRVVVDTTKGRLILGLMESEIEEWLEVEETDRGGSVASPLSVYLNVVDTRSSSTDNDERVAGIGLYRSEFLLTQSEGFPTEEQQYQEYHTLCRGWPNSPVTIRTFDIGGDKSLSFFSLGPQENPFLGLRAHRIYAYHPEILITQTKAILRAGLECGELRLLFPMIETVDDLDTVLSLVGEARAQLDAEGIPYRRDFKQGVLLEVPSVLWTLQEIFGKVDFVSVGTNDLLQYHFAVDRTNGNVGHLYRPYHPTALRALAHIVESAKAASVPVTLCGEIASDPAMVPLLFGLGFSDISVDVHAVDAVRRAVPEGSEDRCRTIAIRCVSASTTTEVGEILRDSSASIPAVPDIDVRTSGISDGAIDPVCGMVVHQTGNPFVLESSDRTHYFCSEDCMQAYQSAVP
ncbi:MAG: phosphoenolpyruvate--protein phosphotransferase [Alkalispirochaeta sp.]